MRESAINRAVIARGQRDGVVLWWVGPAFQALIERDRLEDLYDLRLDDAPRGIVVWEGAYVYVEDDYEPHGAFRLLTADEWVSVRRGVNPWASDVAVEKFCEGCFAPDGAACAQTCPLAGEPEGV